MREGSILPGESDENLHVEGVAKPMYEENCEVQLHMRNLSRCIEWFWSLSEELVISRLPRADQRLIHRVVGVHPHPLRSSRRCRRRRRQMRLQQPTRQPDQGCGSQRRGGNKMDQSRIVDSQGTRPVNPPLVPLLSAEVPSRVDASDAV